MPGFRYVVVLISAVLAAGCSSSGRPVDIAGPRWVLVAVAKGDGAAMPIPSSLNASMEIDPHGEWLGHDGCSPFDAKAHIDGGTLIISDLSIGANGCISDGGPLDLCREAFGSIYETRRAHVSRVGTKLTVTPHGYTMTFRAE